jgi:hypothetical protein
MLNKNKFERFELAIWGSLIRMTKKIDGYSSPADSHPVHGVKIMNRSRLFIQGITVAIIGMMLGLTSGYLLAILFK